MINGINKITRYDVEQMIMESVIKILETKPQPKPNLSSSSLLAGITNNGSVNSGASNQSSGSQNKQIGQNGQQNSNQSQAGQQNGSSGPQNNQQGKNGVGGLLNGVRNFVRKTYNTTMGNYNSQFTNPKYMNNRNGMVQADSNGQSQMSYKEANEWLEKSGMKATDVMNALNNPGGNSAFDNLQTQDPILAQKVIALCKMLTK